MPLFQISKGRLGQVEKTNFVSEKELQSLVEKNLETVFNCRFVASEFPTGPNHAGRIDTLALSEDDNPVIIEYKKVESSELITQSLFYLNWIYDHRGDFEIAVKRALGEVEVDWSDVRVLCIAPNYKKYDLHAVKVMGANIELWTYRLFENSILYLEEVFTKSYESSCQQEPAARSKNPVMVEAGKKAAVTRKTGHYSFEKHIEGKPDKIKDMAIQIQEYVLGLDPSITENPKKFYVGYKISQNIVSMEIKNQKITLYVKLDPKTLGKLPAIARDVTNTGHWGTGDLEITIKNEADFENAKPFIEMAYNRIGG
jgi:predicted transport protein